jgi:hypothetical protein
MKQLGLTIVLLLFSTFGVRAQNDLPHSDDRRNTFGTFIFGYLWFLDGESGASNATIYWRSPVTSARRSREYSLTYDEKSRIVQIGYYVDNVPSVLRSYSYKELTIESKSNNQTGEVSETSYNLTSDGGFFKQTRADGKATTGQLLNVGAGLFIWFGTNPTTLDFVSRGGFLAMSDRFLPLGQYVQTTDEIAEQSSEWRWDGNTLREIVDLVGKKLHQRMVFLTDERGRVVSVQFFDSDDKLFGFEEVEWK